MSYKHNLIHKMEKLIDHKEIDRSGLTGDELYYAGLLLFKYGNGKPAFTQKQVNEINRNKVQFSIKARHIIKEKKELEFELKGLKADINRKDKEIKKKEYRIEELEEILDRLIDERIDLYNSIINTSFMERLKYLFTGKI